MTLRSLLRPLTVIFQMAEAASFEISSQAELNLSRNDPE